MRDQREGKSGQSSEWIGAESPGGRHVGWQALCLTMGSLCSLKGAGSVRVCGGLGGYCRQGGPEAHRSSLGNQAPC